MGRIQPYDFTSAILNICTDLIGGSVPIVLGWTSKALLSWVDSLSKGSGIDKSVNEFTTISAFWKSATDGQLKDGNYISIDGQLSKYTPLLVGPPMSKRELHLKYRKQLEKTKIRDEEKKELNARLAYTAGQMAWRLDLENKPIMYLGLYHSIVRNSIPVFVERGYYQKHVEKVFEKSENPHLVEARIKGKLMDFVKYQEKFAHNKRYTSFIQPQLLSEGSRAIFVDGKKSKIEFLDNPRYLDGDIWVALGDDKSQNFVSRFIDFADIDDLNEEKKLLKSDVEEEYKGTKILFQFDQVSKIFPKYPTATVDDILKRR